MDPTERASIERLCASLRESVERELGRPLPLHLRQAITRLGFSAYRLGQRRRTSRSSTTLPAQRDGE